MRSDKLYAISEEDDVVLKLERFKTGLISRATGKGMEAVEYNDFRKFVLGMPNFEKLIPDFLKTCRTVDEYWDWIKGQASNYADRRKLIAEKLNPLLESAEYESGVGSLEFKKNLEEKELIGNGGFGLVYLFEHRLLKIPFAVKIFAPAFYEGNEKELERFFQEAKILFRLNHPAIIKIYDAGLIGKRPFIRMEYLKVET